MLLVKTLPVVFSKFCHPPKGCHKGGTRGRRRPDTFLRAWCFNYGLPMFTFSSKTYYKIILRWLDINCFGTVFLVWLNSYFAVKSKSALRFMTDDYRRLGHVDSNYIKIWKNMYAYSIIICICTCVNFFHNKAHFLKFKFHALIIYKNYL